MRWLFGLGAATLILLFALVPPIAQPQAYHAFADQRELLAGVPNTLNVLSNVAFVIAGAAGLIVMRGTRCGLERHDATLFFIGTLLTAVGSTIYHLHPNDRTLVYDRAGMIVAFMAFLAMLIHERLDGAAWLLPVLLAIGAASVWWWRAFGDLRLYGWVQYFPILAILLLVGLDKPRHSGEAATLGLVFVSYALAKVFEMLDRSTYQAIGVSGHTLKHLFAAAAPLAVAVMIRRPRGGRNATEDSFVRADRQCHGRR